VSAAEAEAAARSIATYYAPGRGARLDAWYARFVRAGDLAFDIGAHVGDRSACFARLGARVVAVEPQPLLARLTAAFGGRGVKIERCVLGARPGRATLRLNMANPTVATISDAFIAAASGAPGWEGQAWDAAITVRQTTLDALIAKHGVPGFIKIDVEGQEEAVLAGLSRPVAAISAEFTTIQRDVAFGVISRLRALGYRHFNAALGETMAFAFAAPVDAARMRGWLSDLPHAANSGDLYASLDPGRLASSGGNGGDPLGGVQRPAQ